MRPGAFSSLLLVACLAATSCSDDLGIPPTPPAPRISRPVYSNEGIPPQLLKEFAVEANAGSSNKVASTSLLEWNRRTLVGSYIHHGRRQPAWNATACELLEAYAEVITSKTAIHTNTPASLNLERLAKAAIDAGCDDPLIQFIHVWSVQARPPEQLNKGEAAAAASAYAQAGRDLQKTEYPPIRKFIAQVGASKWIRLGVQWPWGYHAALYQDMDSNMHSWAVGSLTELLKNNELPPQIVEESCLAMFEELVWFRMQRDVMVKIVLDTLDTSYPGLSITHLLKGDHLIELAWQARGSDWAHAVTPEGWQQMSEHLAAAEKSLHRAWELNPKDPRIAILMMRVELGQGRGRDRMERWFERAMELDPNSREACTAKLYYLEPKWHGSEKEMLQFARECATSEVWGDSVWLVLGDAHANLAQYWTEEKGDTYWKQPHVWPDIKLAFDRYLKAHPDADQQNNLYAAYAGRCEQWDEFERLLPLIKKVDYKVFGGEKAFKKLVERARALGNRV